MRFDASTSLKSAQLSAWVAHLDTGAGAGAVLEIYSGTAPVPGATPTGSVLLVSITLPKPVGTVLDGVLTLAVSALSLNVASGGADWARWYTAAGAWAGDSDVSNDAGDGFVRLADTTLFAGGKAQVIGGTIVV